jgi:hypothetical protein
MTREIITLIQAMPGDWVFTAYDFLHLGRRESINAALARLARGRVLRRVSRGKYSLI